MNYRKLLSYLTVLLFLGLASLPAWGMLFPALTRDAGENRALAHWPRPFTPQGAEDWFDDHFALRGPMTALYNRVNARTGLTEVNGVATGRDGWLYYMYDGSREDIRREIHYSAEELERSFKTGYAEDGEMPFEEFASCWLKRQTKYAPSTIAAYRRMLEVVYPMIGGIRLNKLRPMALENMLSELRAEHFRNFYAELRKVIRPDTKKPLSEYTIEGVHATLCSILSDAVEGGFLSHNPAWRTYRYAGRKCEKKIADEETAQKIIAALESESIKYETYFKLIIATGMRRGECCGLKWCDIDWEQRSIHICRNAVKVTDEEIFVKEPKTRAGDRYVYFSAEMESLLWEYRQECAYITEAYDRRELTADDFLFRRQGAQLPMTPTTFTYRFKLILKKNGLPQELNVHSLRHTAASLMIAGGTDVATVAGILGHSQPSTTLDIYTHAFDKNKKAASAGLQGMLEI